MYNELLKALDVRDSDGQEYPQQLGLAATRSVYKDTEGDKDPQPGSHFGLKFVHSPDKDQAPVDIK